MDWAKVAFELDREWHSRRRTAEMRPNDPEVSNHRLLSQIAFMLRDVIVGGLSDDERRQYEALTERE